MILQKLRNINSVAKYESKLLARSWFFRVFVLIVLALGGLIIGTSEGLFEGVFVMPTMCPYLFSLMLNVIQSVAIIFLSADYLKRDKQLDTSEVFYVRPLGNAEYLIGKMWGTLRLFIVLDILVLIGLYGGSILIKSLDVPLMDFFIYFAIIILPSIIFMIGVSTGLMLLLGNQAITFVILLGLTALSLFYVGDLVDNLFDFLAWELPLLKSPVIGFTNQDTFLVHRSIYATAGVGFILFSIYKFKRLAGSTALRPLWLVASLGVLSWSVYLGYDYYRRVNVTEAVRNEMIRLNNQYIDTPRILVDDYDLDVEHLGESIRSKVNLKGVLSEAGDRAIFVLNGGMVVDSVYLASGEELGFERHRHLLLVDLGRQYATADTLDMTLVYQGMIRHDEMFIDIQGDALKVKNASFVLTVDKRTAFIEPQWVILTPESYWYPRGGVSFSDSTLNWQSDYFSNYTLRVKPLAGLMPVSQGKREILADSLSYRFTSEQPLRSLSLAISDYKKIAVEVDSFEYAAYVHASRDRFSEFMEPIKDTIPMLLKDAKDNLERRTTIKYSLNSMSFVDAPVQMFSYHRDWSSTQEVMQPEMLFAPGAFYNKWNYNLEAVFSWYKKAMERGRRPQESDTVMKINMFRDLFWFMSRKEEFAGMEQKKMGQREIKTKANPYYFEAMTFNSKYNVISDSYSWGNQLIEQFLSSNQNDMSWTRNYNGISTMEQALLLLSEKPASEYLSDAKYTKLSSSIIKALGNVIFGEAINVMGVEEFQQALKSTIEKHPFENVRFEMLVDTIAALSGCDIVSNLKKIEEPLELAEYYVGSYLMERYVSPTETVFVTDVVVSNLSDVDGFIQMTYYFRGSDPDIEVVKILGGQTKQITQQFKIEPTYCRVSTLNSRNLPQILGRSIIKASEPALSLRAEGEKIIENFSLLDDNEIIVDNEDEELFSISAPPNSGYLNFWIDKSMENDFKYKAIGWWRPPYRWTLTTNEKYYGTSILSGYCIRAGDGSQAATWKIPLKGAGRYALYFGGSYPQELDWDWYKSRKATYDLELSWGDKKEKIALNLKNFSRNERTNTWALLGDFDIEADTVTIVLTNKTEMWQVNADAVRAVKLK